MATVVNRVVGAIQMKAATFEEVEHDRTATVQAALVVAAAHLAQGVGAYRYGSMTGVLVAVVVGLLGWVIGAAVLLVVGTKLFPDKNTEADMGQMLRTAGFAQAAGLFGVLAIVPAIGWVVYLICSVWILIAMVIAVRQALDYDSTTRAIVVCIVAWLIMLAIQVLAAFFGVGAVVVAGQFS
jgi:hypothetical protein